MISFLRGVVTHKEKDSVVIETSGGVGYEIRMTGVSLAVLSLHSTVSIFTYLKVSDSALDLYGFISREEKAFFELLMTVSGIGPKSALSILSLGNREKIQQAIVRGDVTHLTSVEGIGKKTAERLVVELKSKIGSLGEISVGEFSAGESSLLGEAIEGLLALGYTREEAKQKIKGIETEGKTLEQILRLALKK